MVFEPEAAPRDRPSFMVWYEAITEWSEDRDYNDPAGTTPRLRAWYEDMIEKFPNMNGSDITDEAADSSKLTDYSIAGQAIYVAFAWSEARAAFLATTSLAHKHGLGFFDASAPEGQIDFPGRGFSS